VGIFLAILLILLVTCVIIAWRLKQRLGAQKFIVLCGAVAFIWCGLFPPWLYTFYQTGTRDEAGMRSQTDAGYYFILTPPPPLDRHPAYGVKLDTSRLLIEWACILAVSGAAWAIFGTQRPAVAGTPGAKRIPSGMVVDTLALANQTKTPKPGGTLLIVDYEDGPRQSLGVIFKNEYDLLMAGDGATAIELAKQHDIDVVVTEINMAGMSGIELLERLKLLKPDIAVIMMTGLSTTDTFRESLRLGACDYINKPFDIATIRSAVSKAMQRRRPESEITAARKATGG
jgi:CheY-like chemotaxis protein